MNADRNPPGPSKAAADMPLDLDALQRMLDMQIKLGMARAQSVMDLCLRAPNAHTLAGVDSAIDLLQGLQPDAQRLQQAGRPVAHAQLTACLQDLCAARNTIAQTHGMLSAADRLDASRLATAKALTNNNQRAIVNQRSNSANVQANEVRKLL